MTNKKEKDYVVTRVEDLITYYEREKSNADRIERLIYSTVIADLKDLLTDLIHH
jgi:hypothetical protein